MSVTKLAVRRRVQNTQSICRECSSIRKKARTKIWFSICHSIMRQICSSLLWVRTTANCSILTVSQGRLKLRHIGIQCHFFHFTYPKTPEEDNKGLHIYPFVQTDYKQLKNPNRTDWRKRASGYNDQNKWNLFLTAAVFVLEGNPWRSR